MVERYTGLFLAGLLGLIGLTSLLSAEVTGAQHRDWLDSRTQEDLESAFDDALPHRQLSISLWRGLAYALWRELAEGAVAGQNGWLFSAEEYDFADGAEDRLAERLSLISAVAAELEQREILLVIALVPDKARIYPEQMRRPRPAALEARYATVLAELKRSGLIAPDLARAMRNARAEVAVYLERDTHWTPFGARTIAERIADTLSDIPISRSTFISVEAEPVVHRGDLMNFAETTVFSSALGLHDETVPQTAITQDGSGLGLFDELPPPQVALVGTSYSADPKWQFADFLQLSLSAPILNLAKVGQGPFVPMLDFLENRVEVASDLSVVVWEIPERYLTIREI